MKDSKTFEDSLNELEKIASNLENGELGLDEAEKRINILVQGEDGELKEESFTAEE